MRKIIRGRYMRKIISKEQGHFVERKVDHNKC
jgi:hypothetical protein